jgi:hypothetical protein
MGVDIKIDTWLQDAIIDHLVDVVREEVGEEYYVHFKDAEYGILTITCYSKTKRNYYADKRKQFSYREALKLFLESEDKF